MRWLRKLFGPSDFVPSYGQEQDAVASLDWGRMEDRLVEAAREAVGAFVAANENEVFHRFGLDCAAESAEVLLCLDTRPAAANAAVAALWGFGDWTHHGFNAGSRAWIKSWGKVENDVGNAVGAAITQRRLEALQSLRTGFMDMTCRALRRLELTDEFARLRKGEGFDVLSCEHDESPEAGFERLRRFPSLRRIP